MDKPSWICIVGLLGLLNGCGKQTPQPSAQEPKPAPENPKTTSSEAAKSEETKTMAAEISPDKLPKTDEDWKKTLSAEQYRVLRQKGTERAFAGEFWDNHKDGTYRCAGCGQELFSSKHKFDSGTGWPSYYQAIAEGKVKEEVDRTHGMERVEVHCGRCGGHLGHVFSDGPEPTGLRYCINSVSMKFDEKK